MNCYININKYNKEKNQHLRPFKKYGLINKRKFYQFDICNLYRKKIKNRSLNVT